jgi:hypothetical protein
LAPTGGWRSTYAHNVVVIRGDSLSIIYRIKKYNNRIDGNTVLRMYSAVDHFVSWVLRPAYIRKGRMFFPTPLTDGALYPIPHSPVGFVRPCVYYRVRGQCGSGDGNVHILVFLVGV